MGLNGTRGSLLLAILAHGAVNFTAGFLFPILPLQTSEISQSSAAPLGAQGPLPFFLFGGLLCIAAVAVVLLAGPEHLSRTNRTYR